MRHNRQEAIPTVVPVEPRQDNCSSQAGSKVLAITEALNAYVLSQGIPGTPDSRKEAVRQIGVPLAFLNVAIKDQSQQDDLADKEQDGRKNSTLATIQEVAELRGKLER